MENFQESQEEKSKEKTMRSLDCVFDFVLEDKTVSIFIFFGKFTFILMLLRTVK